MPRHTQQQPQRDKENSAPSFYAKLAMAREELKKRAQEQKRVLQPLREIQEPQIPQESGIGKLYAFHSVLPSRREISPLAREIRNFCRHSRHLRSPYGSSKAHKELIAARAPQRPLPATPDRATSPAAYDFSLLESSLKKVEAAELPLQRPLKLDSPSEGPFAQSERLTGLSGLLSSHTEEGPGGAGSGPLDLRTPKFSTQSSPLKPKNIRKKPPQRLSIYELGDNTARDAGLERSRHRARLERELSQISAQNERRREQALNRSASLLSVSRRSTIDIVDNGGWRSYRQQREARSGGFRATMASIVKIKADITALNRTYERLRASNRDLEGRIERLR